MRIFEFCESHDNNTGTVHHRMVDMGSYIKLKAERDYYLEVMKPWCWCDEMIKDEVPCEVCIALSAGRKIRNKED